MKGGVRTAQASSTKEKTPQRISLALDFPPCFQRFGVRVLKQSWLLEIQLECNNLRNRLSYCRWSRATKLEPLTPTLSPKGERVKSYCSAACTLARTSRQ